jgi:hypothetical protein
MFSDEENTKRKRPILERAPMNDRERINLEIEPLATNRAIASHAINVANVQ